MATTVLKDSYIAMTDYTADGYHRAYYRCGGLSYDSVTRSGNTVTMTNCKIKSYVQFVRTDGYYFGYASVYYDWIGIWDSSSTTAAGTAPIAKTVQFQNNTAGARYFDTPHTVRTGDLSIGNISFTVSGNNAGTKTFKLALAFGLSNSNADSNSYRESSDPAPSFTVSYPANLVNLTVKGSKDGTAQDTTAGMGSFDVTIGTTKEGDNVNTYNTGHIYGSSYTVDDVRETSNNYYYTGSSSYTGTLNSATTVTLPFASTTNPATPTPVIVSRDWNSITARATVSNYGAPASRTGRYIEIGLAPATATAYSGVVLKQSATDTTSTANKIFNQDNDNNNLIIAGARSFKICGYANNTKKGVANILSTVYWLPPAPLVSATLTDTTQNATDATISVRIVGAARDNVKNISGARVDTQYRYSLDNGVTFNTWTNVSTNLAPDTPVEAHVNVPYNTDILFQVRQATTGDTTQVTEELNLNIPAIVPIPPDPEIRYSYDELNRTMTITVNNGVGYGTQFESCDLQLKYFEDVAFVDVNLTTNPSVYTISYLHPNKRLLISARTNTTGGGQGSWVTVETTVRRPIWGIITKKDADGNDEQHLIRDMVKVVGGTVSERDWIEGQFVGEKRIVKN